MHNKTVLCFILLSLCYVWTLQQDVIINEDYTFPQKITLIIPDEQNPSELKLTEKGCAFLRTLKERITLVTIVGRARSGKSFTANRLLGISNEGGFPIGHTEQPETVGMSLWSTPLPGTGNKTGHPPVYIIDTEGLGVGSQFHDKALLILSTVISSKIVYHLSSYVYTDDIVRLYGMAYLAESYRQRHVISHIPLPSIQWVVQKYEFAHLITDHKQSFAKQLLTTTWLVEHENPTNDINIAQFNTTVRSILSLFTIDSVYLLPRAYHKNDTTTRIPDLIPLYNEYMTTMRTELQTTQPKEVPGYTVMNGDAIVHLIRTILPLANENIDIVSDKMVHAVVMQLVATHTELYRNEMMALPLPLAIEDYHEQSAQSKLVWMEVFTKSTPLTDNHRDAQRSLLQAFSIVDTEITHINDKLSDSLCQRVEQEAEMIIVHEMLGTNDDQTTSSVPHVWNQLVYDAIKQVALSHYYSQAKGPHVQWYATKIERYCNALQQSFNTRQMNTFDPPITQFNILLFGFIFASICVALIECSCQHNLCLRGVLYTLIFCMTSIIIGRYYIALTSTLSLQDIMCWFVPQ